MKFVLELEIKEEARKDLAREFEKEFSAGDVLTAVWQYIENHAVLNILDPAELDIVVTRNSLDVNLGPIV